METYKPTERVPVDDVANEIVRRRRELAEHIAMLVVRQYRRKRLAATDTEASVDSVPTSNTT